MAAPTQTKKDASLKLKLVVNKESNKVIYAEAGKDFVDVLFSFLTLPLGSIARLVEKESNMGPVTIGCLISLYHSVADLDKECFWDEKCKEMLLHPKNSSEDYCSTLELNIDDTQPTNYFTCSKTICCYRGVSTSPNHKCMCGYHSRSILSKPISKGFVSSFAMFFITDDLIVKPNSMNCTSFDLLQNSGIKSATSVKEMNVNITEEKVLDLLKCAFHSHSILTYLFLGKSHFWMGYKIFPCDVENTSNIQIKLKLFIRKKDQMILFALCEEDFADIILSFLTFPLGGVVRKLEGKCSFGGISGLYKSIADLDENRFMISKDAKDRLMNPHLAPQFKSSRQILPIQELCNRDGRIALHSDWICASNCLGVMPVNPNSSFANAEGYVKGPRMYVVKDELAVSQASSISPLDILDNLGILLSDLKEKFVTIGIKECLNILQAFLISKSALSMGLCHLLTEV